MEEQKTEVVEEQQETQVDEPAVPEQPQPEAPEPEAEAAPEPEPQREPEPEEPNPSRRESLRIQQVIERARRGEYLPQQQQTPGGLDYRNALEADDETITRLEADRRAATEQAYSQGMAQAQSIQFHTRLEIDAPKIESKYPELDKSSDKFDPALADSINREYLMWAGYDPATGMVANPSIRYAEFVEARIEQAERIASIRAEQTTRNIARQAANTGIRPDGGAAKPLDLSKAPEDMTDDELKAAIAASLPRKR